MQDLLIPQDQFFKDDFYKDMKLRSEEKQWLQGEVSRLVKDSVADAASQIESQIREEFRPRGFRRVTYCIKEWGGVAAIVAVFLTVLFFAVARVEKEATFEAKTTDSLNIINGELAKLSLTGHASLPLNEFKATLPNLSADIAAVRKQNLTVPTSIVDNLQQRLIATDPSSPGFWPAAGELISYRSINSSRANNSLLSPRLPNCTDSPPKPMMITSVTSPGNYQISRATYENCTFTLDSEQDSQRLNDVVVNGAPLITFKHCIIVYRGGAVNLPFVWDNAPRTATVKNHITGQTTLVPIHISGNVLQFENCLFVFSIQREPPIRGQEIAKTLLAQSGDILILPNKAA